MITCPWCGTNYAVFQSNCKNCGGPLTGQTPAAASPEVPEVIVPPPAPRPVSKNYVWKLMLTDGWAIAAGVFVLMGFIFAGVGAILTIAIVTAFVGIPFLLIGLAELGGAAAVFYWRYQVFSKRVQVLQIGEAVLGQVAGAEQNLSVRINGRSPWIITYRFVSPQGEVEGRVSTLNDLGPQLQPGRPVYVLYLPGAPENNTIYPHP